MKKILFTFALCSSFQSFAQSNDEIKKMFGDKLKDDLEWYLEAYSNTGYDSYWIERDSLYNCTSYSGQSIAMTDIDFTKREIKASDRHLVKDTKNKVYILTLSPLTGKQTLDGSCFLGQTSFSKSASKPLELEMKSKEEAERSFEFLKQWKKGDSPNKIMSRYEEIMAELGAPPANTIPFGFDSQLRQLIDGLKDNYASMNEGELGDGYYKCKVTLEGSSTKIYRSMLGEFSAIADFGEYKTEEECYKAYKEVQQKVSDAKTMPCPMVVQNETTSDVGRIETWLPFDAKGILDPALKGFYIELEMMKSVTFDKEYHILHVYSLVLRIKHS